MCRKLKLDHLPIPYTRINSKLIKDLNVRSWTIKILEENIGSQISDIACSNVLLDTSPSARETKEKKNKWDYIKRKLFCTAKETINDMKRYPTEWENIFTNTSDKGLISKIYKELTPTQHQKTLLKNELRAWTDTYPMKTYRWTI